MDKFKCDYCPITFPNTEDGICEYKQHVMNHKYNEVDD